MSEDTVRLGGMALQNGVLVHGPTSWGCAVRGDDGALHIAAGRKPHLAPAARKRVPVLRGPISPCGGIRSAADGAAGDSAGALPVRATERAGRDSRHRGRGEGPSPLAPVGRDAGDRRCRRRVPSRRAGTARARPRRLSRGRAHLDRDVRERRRARAEGASTLRIAAHRAHGRVVARRQRGRREGAARHAQPGSPRRDGRSDRRLRGDLLVGCA